MLIGVLGTLRTRDVSRRQSKVRIETSLRIPRLFSVLTDTRDENRFTAIVRLVHSLLSCFFFLCDASSGGFLIFFAAFSASKSLRGLVLSSSVDWTTRLWRLGKGSNTPLQSLTHGTYDYVCDAKW